MDLLFVVPQGFSTPPLVDEKPLNLEEARNPVLESAEYAYQVSRVSSQLAIVKVIRSFDKENKPPQH